MKAMGQQASFSGAETQDHQHPAKLPDLGRVDSDLDSSSYLARIYKSLYRFLICVSKCLYQKSKSQFREGGISVSFHFPILKYIYILIIHFHLFLLLRKSMHGMILSRFPPNRTFFFFFCWHYPSSNSATKY